MKSIALLASALTATALTTQAQTAAAPAPAAPPADTITFTPTWVSNYMFRGQKLGGSSFEPSVEYDSGNFGVGVWMNFPIKNKVPGQSDPEIDPYAFYTYAINDALSVVPGITVYTYPRAEGANGFYNYTIEPSIALNYSWQGFKLTPKLYYDFVLDAPTAEITVGYTAPLKEIGTELDFTGQYGQYLVSDAVRNSDPKVKAWGDYYLIGVSMPYQIGKAKFTLGYAYTGYNDFNIKAGSAPRVGPTPTGKNVVTASLSWTF